jgi:uncharacterized protein YkwD
MVAVVVGCAQRTARFRAERIDVPDESLQYITEARPEGAVGPGAQRLQAEIGQAVAERGTRAESDGALMAAASWALNEANKGHVVDSIAIESAARYFGFAGVVVGLATFEMGDQGVWREGLEGIPLNMPITRYGIRVSPSGLSASVVFGSMEARFEPVPRTLEPGQSLVFKGQVAPRFTSCHVYLTKPDGKVDPQHLSGRDFAATIAFEGAGKYQLEVMGDGASGPVIALNFPVYVGILAELPLLSPPGRSVDPAEAEVRMLELLNQARREARVNPLQLDAELREVALAHSEDMADHGFMGHVSPSTGTPDQRRERSGVLVSMFGENVAMAATPEVAHQGLMQSPGHRGNMLRPEFTHVGIGAASTDNSLFVTMNFGRRPGAAALPVSAQQVEAALTALRAEKGVPPVSFDPTYQVVAQAAAVAFGNGDERSEIDEVVARTLRREADRLKKDIPGSCIVMLELLELTQLRDVPLLTQPESRRVGVGTQPRASEKGRSLATVMLVEGARCQ